MSRKFEVIVETADHLDWIDVSVNQDAGGYHDNWYVMGLRSLDQLKQVHEAIGKYLGEHDVDIDNRCT